MARKVSLLALLVLIAIIGVLFYRVMAGFFVPLFLAALLVVIFHPMHEWISKRLGNRPQIAALVTTFSILLIVLLPMTLAMVVATMQGARVLGQFHLSVDNALVRARKSMGLELPYHDDVRRVDEALQQLLAQDEEGSNGRVLKAAEGAYLAMQNLYDKSHTEKYGMLATVDMEEALSTLQGLASSLKTEPVDITEVMRLRLQASDQWLLLRRQVLGGPIRAELIDWSHPTSAQVAGWLHQVQPTLVSLTGATGAAVGRIVIGLAIMVISLYFFLVDGPKMIKSLMALSPLDDRYEKQLLQEFDAISRAVVLATILSAVAQGILASIGYIFAGFGSVMLLLILTTILALIPFLGAAAVWIPCSLYLGVVEDRWTAAILLALYGAIIVSSVDNVIKAVILHGRSRLHPLLALLSVLGGVGVFGAIGILIGPMIVVFLQTSLEILNRELAEGHLPTPMSSPGSAAHRQGVRLRAALGQRRRFTS